jgi:hypothetical protein
MSYRGREGALKIHAPGSWGNYDDCGYLAPIALHIEQTKLGELLAELAKVYYAHV